MIIKVGGVNIAGPGFIVVETGMRQNLNINSSNGDFACASDGAANSRVEDYIFDVYAQQQCTLLRAYELEKRVQDELDKALDHGGHMTYLYKYEGYTRRRELKSGTISEKLQELKYKSKRTVAFELDISVQQTRILDPVRLQNIIIEIDWTDNSDPILAKLVMTNTTVPAQLYTASFITDFTVLDEFDGDNYTEIPVPNRTNPELSNYLSGDLVWSLLGSGARQIAGIVIYHVATTRFLGWIPASNWSSGSFDNGLFDPEGDTIIFPVNARGLVRTDSAL